MNRNNNITYSRMANTKILQYLKTIKGYKAIHEVRDYQQATHQLQGMQKLENDVNIHLGIDYVLEIDNKTHYIDTKGFNYNPKYYGSIENGIVETMLLQVEKCYGGQIYHGWANNPNHLTEFILVLIQNTLYILDYKRLVTYCKRFGRDNVSFITFNKGYGSYEICIKRPINELVNEKVITHIVKID